MYKDDKHKYFPQKAENTLLILYPEHTMRN